MRIGIFRPGMTKPGGTETFLTEVIRRLKDRHKFFLVTDEKPEFAERWGIEVEVLPDISRFRIAGRDAFEIESLTLYASSRLNRVFDRAEVDVWSTHFWLENLLISRYVDTPNFFRFPGIQGPRLHWKVMARFDDPDFYISNSEDTKRRAKEWFDIDCRDTVYAGVDTERFSPDTDPEFESDEVDIMYVGRLDTGKGLLGLVEAFSRLKGDSRLWLIGSGSLGGKLRKRARELGVEDRVELPGQMEHEDIPNWLAAADIFCLPSKHEGFPVSNLEALASGKPVVVSDLPATREQISGSGAGVFFDYRDWEGLGDALQGLVDDAEKRKEMGKRAREVGLHFDWDSQARKMEAYYQECLE